MESCKYGFLLSFFSSGKTVDIDLGVFVQLTTVVNGSTISETDNVMKGLTTSLEIPQLLLLLVLEAVTNGMFVV